MTYKEIQGWFNYEFLFTDMVNRFNHCKFIEIGCWKGKSTTFLASQIKQHKKDIKVIAVDTWQGSPAEQQHKDLINQIDQELFQIFQDNIEKMKLIDIVHPMIGDSSTILNEWTEKVPFIFIDGDHTYEGVKKDILAALPLIESDGVLAGHDYGNAEGVTQAVNELLGKDKIQIKKNTWIYDTVNIP